MSATYTLPQVQVFQDVSQVPTAVVSNLNPYVYGANYSLRRYSEASEKALIGIGAYSPTMGNAAAYPSLIAGSAVDQAYVKLYADSAWLKYQTVPNLAANPLVLTSAGIRNRLRAAPRIVDGDEYCKSGGPAVTIAPAGYHTGLISLPEAYYFTFDAAFTLGTGVGQFNWLTTNGTVGHIVVPANATTSGVKTQGPHGIVFDFGGPGAVKPVKTVVISDGTSSFSLGIGGSVRTAQDLFDNNIDGANKLKINVTATDGSVLSVTYADNLLALVIKTGAGGTSLSAMRAAIVAVGAVLQDFTVSAISGATNNVVTTVKDQESNSLAGGTDIDIIPFVFRAYVYANGWVFQTANGVTRSASLLKDVAVGDKIKWTVTPASTGIEATGYSSIVGFEPEHTAPSTGAAAAASTNAGTSAGTDLSSGVADLSAGADNQNTDFNMTTSKTYGLSASFHYPLLSLAANILTDDYIITVTRAGLAGTAQVQVANASGTYLRTAVPVETAAGAGQIYIGNNMYVDFVTGGDANFYIGDTWTAKAVKAPFTAITGESSSGIYSGPSDTTYQIEVTRGGVFTPVAAATAGITSTAGATLNVDVSGWTGGDVDDEYILKVVTGGTLGATVFSLTSQRSDNVTGITFAGYGAGNEITIGASGLLAYFTTGAVPVFAAGDYWVIAVKAARPKVRITDSAGLDQSISAVVGGGSLISVGLYGVKITFPANTNTLGGFATGGGLTQGDIFTIAASASDPGAVQTLVLADELPATITAGLALDGTSDYAPDRFAADLMLVRASVAIPEEDHDPLSTPGSYNWEPSTTGITVEAGITLQDSSWVDGMGNTPFIPLVAGSLYVQYRSLLTTYANAIYSISDLTQVVPMLGPDVEDNPLSLAVYSAVENLGRGTCYFSAITTDDVDGDNGALARAGLVTYTYALTPAGVTDPARHAALVAHIDAMSTEVKKRWRIGLVGREIPVTTSVLTAATNPAGTDWKATVAADTRGGGTLITKVTLTQDGQLLTRLKVGDTVHLQFTTDAWGSTAYVTDTVAEIGNNTVFYLATGLSAPVPVANKLEVYHPLSVQEQADAVAAMAAGYDNKRLYVCFPGNLGMDGVYVNAAYGAASVAGLVGSVVPQQGLTNIELNGYNDVPYSYGVFSYDQLNEIAGTGTLIIMQDTKGGTVYVRHQVSTAYQDGNLNTQEMSMVKNLDSISFYFAQLLAPFIGRYNVTPELVSVIKTQIQDGLNYLGSLTGVGMLGPQVILSNGNTKIVTIEQHPTLKDRILAIVNIELPAPLNVIEFHIVV